MFRLVPVVCIQVSTVSLCSGLVRIACVQVGTDSLCPGVSTGFDCALAVRRVVA